MVNARVSDADYTGEIKVVLVNLGRENYSVHLGDKIAQLIVERIISDKAILVQDLETTTRGIKGLGTSDKQVTKQVSTVPDCLVSSPGKLREDQTPKAATINIQKAGSLLSYSQKISGPTKQGEGHNPSKNTAVNGGTIQVSKITEKEFRKAYRNGETTGVVKFSEKEKQIYLRRINISTELVIRNKEERRTKAKLEEDSLESLVPGEYYELLPAFEKGEKN